MGLAKFEFTEQQPAPSRQLPKSYKYFLLGCGVCRDSVSFRVSGEGRIAKVESIISDVSPRTETRQAYAFSDANTVCPKRGRPCPSREAIEMAELELQEVTF